jgi:hypothetical protein
MARPDHERPGLVQVTPRESARYVCIHILVDGVGVAAVRAAGSGVAVRRRVLACPGGILRHLTVDISGGMDNTGTANKAPARNRRQVSVRWDRSERTPSQCHMGSIPCEHRTTVFHNLEVADIYSLLSHPNRTRGSRTAQQNT